MSKIIEETSNNTLTKRQELLRNLRKVKEQIDKYGGIKSNKPMFLELQPVDKYDNQIDEEYNQSISHPNIEEEYNKAHKDYYGVYRDGFVKMHQYTIDGTTYGFTKNGITPRPEKVPLKKSNNVMPNYWKTFGIKPWMWFIIVIFLLIGIPSLLATTDPNPKQVHVVAWKVTLFGAAAFIVIPSIITGLAYLFKALSFIPKEKELKKENEKIKEENVRLERIEAAYRVWKEESERKIKEIENSQEYLDWKEECNKIMNEIEEKYDAKRRKENEDIKRQNAEKSAKYDRDVANAREEMEQNIQSIMDFPESEFCHINSLIGIVEQGRAETLKEAINICREDIDRTLREDYEEELQHKINKKAKECRHCMYYTTCNKFKTEESLYCRRFVDVDEKW